MNNILQFQDNDYFYDMVNSYKMAVSGLLLFHPHFHETLRALNPEQQGRLVGVATQEYGSISFDIFEQIYHLDKGLINLGQVTDNLAYMLVNTAYESVKPLLDQTNPVHEFFRHTRNASSHGGNWHFMNNQPSRPAEWRGRQLSSALNGTPMLNTDVAPGDLLILLWDVEQTLPKQPVV